MWRIFNITINNLHFYLPNIHIYRCIRTHSKYSIYTCIQYSRAHKHICMHSRIYAHATAHAICAYTCIKSYVCTYRSHTYVHTFIYVHMYTVQIRFAAQIRIEQCINLYTMYSTNDDWMSNHKFVQISFVHISYWSPSL